MSDTLLDQADALMRRRSFVAGAQNPPGATAAQAEPVAEPAGEDVPVLTEVVAFDDSLLLSADTPESAAQTTAHWQIENAVRARLDQFLAERSTELAQEIEAWLDEQMPQLVIRAMDGITDHLVALLANRARDELLPRLEVALRHVDEDGPNHAE